MIGKRRFRIIATSLTLGAILVLVCIQTPCQYRNMPSTVYSTANSDFFLESDTQSASVDRREPEYFTQQNIVQEKNVKEIRSMRATAYDLGINSCGKRYGHPARGIAASGTNLNGLSREQAMIVSSTEFPLMTKLSITFAEPYEHYNGIYMVGDTGNLKHGTLDIYVGDYGERTSDEAINFGVRMVEVHVLE